MTQSREQGSCKSRGRSPNNQAAGGNQYCILSSLTILYQCVDGNNISHCLGGFCDDLGDIICSYKMNQLSNITQYSVYLTDASL